MQVNKCVTFDEYKLMTTVTFYVDFADADNDTNLITAYWFYYSNESEAI